MRLKSGFLEYLLQFLAEDNINSNIIKKSVKFIGFIDFTQEIIEFYCYLLSNNFGKFQYIRPQMVMEIQFYAVKILNNNRSELFCAAIKLIN